MKIPKFWRSYYGVIIDQFDRHFSKISRDAERKLLMLIDKENTNLNYLINERFKAVSKIYDIGILKFNYDDWFLIGTYNADYESSWKYLNRLIRIIDGKIIDNQNRKWNKEE